MSLEPLVGPTLRRACPADAGGPHLHRDRLARAKNSMNVAIKNVVDSGLIEKYVVSSKEQVATIRRAVATGDASARWQAAHALKSSSGMLGASTLAEWCRQLEALGRAATLERVPDVLSKLEAAYPTVCAALEEEVGKGD